MAPAGRPVKTIVCPSCKQSFNYREVPHPSAKLPHLLNCGHALCESCVKGVPKHQRRLKCVICSQETVLPEAEIAGKSLPVDDYIVGIIVRKRREGYIEDSRLNFSPPGFSFPAHAKHGSKQDMCVECRKNVATWKCDRCTEKYCSICFDRVHRGSRSLQKHQAVSLEHEHKSQLITTCPMHEDKGIEFSCCDDGENICAHCIIMGDHQGHTVITIKEKNEKCLDEMKKAVGEAETILSRLKFTQKKLETASPTLQPDQLGISQKVQNHFLHLHGVLQVAEHRCLEQLGQLVGQQSEYLHDMNLVVSGQIKKLQSLLEEAAKVTEAVSSSRAVGTNLPDLIEQLLNSREIPCHLVPTEQQDCLKEDEIRFQVDEDIIKVLQRHCHLEADIALQYKLLSTQDLPELFVVQDIEEDAGSVTGQSLSSQSSSVKIGDILPLEFPLDEGDAAIPAVSHDKAGSKPQSVSEVTRVQTTTTKFYQEHMIVTHIRNPSQFYVQRMAASAQLLSLSKSLNRWAKSSKSTSKIPKEVEPGQLYAVQYSQDKAWYRARVQKIIEPTEEGQAKMISIIYVDYGNVENVSVSKMRYLPEKFLEEAPMSLQCCLWDIVPAKGTEWSVDSINTFAELVKKGPLLMTVMKHQGDIYYIDLSKLPDINIKSDQPVSVKDALVFLELASIPSEKYEKSLYPQQNYFALQGLTRGISVDALVSYIETPESFYIQLLENYGRSLSTLISEMQKTYNNTASSDCWAIYAPKIGMLCVAKYSCDRNWYRARIESLPGGQMVKVYFVDFGNRECVKWQSLRKLLDNYMKLPAQAVHCCLTDVVPKDLRAGWTANTCQVFSRAVEGRQLRLFIDDVDSGNSKQKLSVTLYECRSDVDICINGLLCKGNYARSIGNSSIRMEYPRLDYEPVKEPKADKYIPKKSIAREKEVSADRSRTAPVECQTSASAAMQKQIKIPVKVSCCISPNCIYIQTDLQGRSGSLQSMMSTMQQIYAGSKPESKKWSANDICAAKYGKDQCWYRAQITSLPADGKAEVLVLDYGYTDTVPLSDLRTLTPNLQKSRAFAVKCRLANICAAGDKDIWSGLACEQLQELINQYNMLYITKMGNVGDDRVLPIDLLVEEMVETGALEPTRTVYASLGEKLVQMGLAIPLHRVSRESVTKVSPLIRDSDSIHAVSQTDLEQTESCLTEDQNNSKTEVRTEEDGGAGQEIQKGAVTEHMTRVEEGEERKELEDDTVKQVTTVGEEDKGEEREKSGIDEHENRVEKEEKNEGGRITEQVTTTQGGKKIEEDKQENGTTKHVTTVTKEEKGELLESGDGILEFLTGVGDEEEAAENEQERDECGISRRLNELGYEEEEEQQEEVDQGGVMKHMTGVDWKPTELLEMWKKTEMSVIPTYVNEDCHIFLHDKEKSCEVLRVIKNILDAQFQGSSPKPHDLYWFPGLPCISQYHLDNSWYRGRIVKVNDTAGTVEVEFVDYGNRETVKVAQLRKNIYLETIPIQCIRCKLHNIAPNTTDGKWPTNVLDFIHKTIVDQACSIEIKKKPVETEAMQIALMLSSRQDLGDVLVAAGFAMRSDEDDGSNEECEGEVLVVSENDVMFEPLSSSCQIEVNNPYRELSLPSNEDLIPIIVTGLLNPRNIYLQIAAQEMRETEYLKQVAEDNKRFLAICEELNNSAEQFPPVSNPAPGIACCCQYSRDSRWYRALVLSTPDSTTARVLYVDFGNSEIARIDSLRELPLSYLSLPVQAVQCQLHGVGPAGGTDWAGKVITAMIQALFQTPLPLWARIRDTDSPPSVDLFSVSSSGAQLVYQPLIDAGLISRHEEPEVAGNSESDPEQAADVVPETETETEKISRECEPGPELADNEQVKEREP